MDNGHRQEQRKVHNRDTNGQEQGHKWTRTTSGPGQQVDRRTGRGAGTQADRNRNTDGQGHSQTRTGTQMDRGRDTEGQGKGHKRTRTGIWTQTFTTLTDNLQKNKRVESVKF
jgi:hypothetical protein